MSKAVTCMPAHVEVLLLEKDRMRFGNLFCVCLPIKGRNRLVAVAGVVVLLMLAVSVAAKAWGKEVTVKADGRELTFRTRATTVAGVLAEAGIAVLPDDLVVPDPEAPISGRTEVRVTRAVPVSVIADGRQMRVRTTGPTVAQVLERAGVRLGATDRVKPGLEEAIAEDMVITVTRVNEEVVVQKVSIPFQVQKREDGELELGISKVVQKGEPGLKEVTVRVIKENGKPVKKTVIAEKVLKQPVAQVVAMGTCGVVSRGGHTIRFRKALEVIATAYTPGPESTGASADGYTATGLRATYGVVAVDPKVIPLMSRVYVEGYGFAVAGDVGGAIKGARIDVCFDSKAEALKWGRRKVKVYILQ